MTQIYWLRYKKNSENKNPIVSYNPIIILLCMKWHKNKLETRNKLKNKKQVDCWISVI